MIADKDQHGWELQSTLEELQARSRPPQLAETGVQTEPSEPRTVARQEAPKTEATLPHAPAGRQEVPHGHTAGEKRRRPDSAGRRRRENPTHKDLVRLRSPKPGSVGEQESNLEYEMRAAGVEITDSFDSSECVGFSDVTLDDTLHDAGSAVSLESLKSERTAPERERSAEPPPAGEGEEKGSESRAKPGEQLQSQPQREEAVLAVMQRQDQPEPVTEPTESGSGGQNATAIDLPCPPEVQLATTSEAVATTSEAVATASEMVSTASEVVGGAAGGEIAVTNLEDLAETSSEEVNSSSSESDLPALKRKSESPRLCPVILSPAPQWSMAPADGL